MAPQLMKTIIRSSSASRAASSISCVILFVAISASGQTPVGLPPAQTQASPIIQGKRQQTATVRSSDSGGGSRVALTSDQSLGDYEAYRRGDRFYVRVPAADVQRLTGLHGKAFADVRAYRTSDSTLVSFRLQPGAIAHVEPGANRLDIVIALPSDRASVTDSQNNQPTQQPFTNSRRDELQARELARTRANASVPPGGNTSASISADTQASPSANLSSTRAPEILPANSTIVRNQTQTQDARARFKERVHSWILFARRNPIPVTLGVVPVLLLVAIALYRRKKQQASMDAKSGEVTPKDLAPETKANAADVPAASSAEVATVPANNQVAAAGSKNNHDKSEEPMDAETAPITSDLPLTESPAPPPSYQSNTEREVFEL
jgi:hypothetical protein